MEIGSLSSRANLSLCLIPHTLNLIHEIRINLGQYISHLRELITRIGGPNNLTHIGLIRKIILDWISIIADQTANAQLLPDLCLPVIIGLEGTVRFPLGGQSQIGLGHVLLVVVRGVDHAQAVQDVVVGQVLPQFSD